MKKKEKSNSVKNNNLGKKNRGKVDTLTEQHNVLVISPRTVFEVLSKI